MSVELKILGNVEIATAGRIVTIRGVKPRQLLTALALSPNAVIPVDRLIDALWPKDPPRSVLENLRTYATALRQGFAAGSEPGPSLTTSTEGYRLEVDESKVDAYRFTRLLKSAREALERRELTAGAAELTEALALWRGRASEGLPRNSWLGNALDALDAHRTLAHEERAEVYLVLGRHIELVPELVRLVAEYPLRERLWRQLMLAHYRCGNMGAAVAVFTRVRTILTEELGVDPSEELTELYRSILRRDATLGHTSAPSAPRQIPMPDGSLFGREPELTRLRHLFAGARQGRIAVTISGAPGIGKSTLAQWAAHGAANHFPDGQLYVDFRSLGQPCDAAGLLAVANTLLCSLGFGQAADLATASAQWRGLLAGRRVLILLDNAVSADQVAPFLPAGHGCAVIVTSPQTLAIAGIGHHLDLGPLDRADSVEFLTSVIGVSRTGTDPNAVAQVAGLCGDSPAALQMAALRMVCRPDWTVAEWWQRLQSAPSLFDELRGGGRSLQATYITAFAELAMVDTEAAQALWRLAQQPPGTPVSPQVAGSWRGLETLADFHLLEAPAPGLFKLPRFVRELAAHSADHA